MPRNGAILAGPGEGDPNRAPQLGGTGICRALTTGDGIVLAIEEVQIPADDAGVRAGGIGASGSRQQKNL